MKTEWLKRTGRRVDSIEVFEGQVFVGTDLGCGGHGCSAAAASIQEFRAGKLNSLVEEAFGQDVLKEVLHSLQHAA